MTQINYRIKIIENRAVFQVHCPCCGKPFTLQKDKRPNRNTSIGAHMIDAHDYCNGDLNSFVNDCRSIMRRDKTERRIKNENDLHAARIESERQAKLRDIAARKREQATITLTASDVDDIQSEIHSLIRMMEPYYAQCDCDVDARALVDRLEFMLVGGDS